MTVEVLLKLGSKGDEVAGMQARRGDRRRRGFGAPAISVISLLAGALSLVVGTAVPAGAAIAPQTGPAGALAIAQALASSSANVTAASFVAVPGGTPNGTSTTALGGFPTNGSSFGVLTSGDVKLVPNTGTFASVSDAGPNVRGNTDLDVTILKVDLLVQGGANCASFDFRFLSEEYPVYVGSSFNDAFIAELDSSTWTTAGSTITAPNNFAFDSSNHVVSINSTGIGGMSATNGAGTAYDGGSNQGGATVLLHASTQITPGPHSLYFSLFDQGDRNLDSAVFLDNLAVGFVPNPAVNCVGGATPVNFKLSLTPAAATNPVGSSHTVTATLTDPGGVAIANAPIIFTVSGVHNVTGTGTTNATGNATFTYAGTTAGTDQINACYQPSGSPPCAATASATKTWTGGGGGGPVPTKLTLNGATTSDFNDPATVSAKLTDSGGGAVGSKPVTLTLNTSESCVGTTDATGSASCSITPHQPAGSYTLTASFAGDAGYLASNTSGPFIVTLEETTLTYTGATAIANGTPASLSGVLREDGIAPIAGRTVVFTVGSGTGAQSCSGTTNASGAADCTISSVSQPSASTSVPASAAFAGDAFYEAAATSATVPLRYMTGRAYGVSLTSPLLPVTPVPDTGAVSTASASSTSTPCVATVSGILSARTLCANVTTALNPGRSTSTASVESAALGLPLLPAIQLQAVQATSQTTCSGSTGTTTIAYLKIGNTVPVANPVQPAANTTFSVAGLKVVLNEQVAVPGASQGITVIAVHITGLGVNLVVASATSDIHNCT